MDRTEIEAKIAEAIEQIMAEGKESELLRVIGGVDSVKDAHNELGELLSIEKRGETHD